MYTLIRPNERFDKVKPGVYKLRKLSAKITQIRRSVTIRRLAMANPICPKCSGQMGKNHNPMAVTGVDVQEGAKLTFMPASGIPLWFFMCTSCNYVELYALSEEERQAGLP